MIRVVATLIKDAGSRWRTKGDSMIGHLVYGAILGISYPWLKSRGNAHQAAGTHVGTLAELCMYNALSKHTDLRREEL